MENFNVVRTLQHEETLKYSYDVQKVEGEIFKCGKYAIGLVQEKDIMITYDLRTGASIQSSGEKELTIRMTKESLMNESYAVDTVLEKRMRRYSLGGIKMPVNDVTIFKDVKEL